MPDIGHCQLAQIPGFGDAAEITLDKGDARTFHGDVGAGAHGDSDVRPCQRRRVVDAVARHRNPLAGGLELADHPVLVLGRDIGVDFVDPDHGTHRLRGRLGVAGQHDHMDPGFVK